MQNTLFPLILAALILPGCSTNLNPVNWFGPSEPAQAPAPTAENPNPLIPERTGIFQNRGAQQVIYLGTPVASVSSVLVERVPGGAIIRAEGVASVQGVFDVRLTPATADEIPEDGVLTYRLEGVHPAGATAGPANTREVIAARSVTDRTLAGVRSIRVEGAQNAQAVRR